MHLSKYSLRTLETVDLSVAKPIKLYKLTPAQIELVEKLASVRDMRIEMEKLEYREIVAYQELAKLGFADMEIGRRRKAWIVLTEQGARVRTAGYFSKRAVVNLTEPQINLLRFLDDGPALESVGRASSEIPETMIDVCRRMSLRGWVEWSEGWRGTRWAKLTDEGRAVLMAVDATMG